MVTDTETETKSKSAESNQLRKYRVLIDPDQHVDLLCTEILTHDGWLTLWEGISLVARFRAAAIIGAYFIDAPRKEGPSRGTRENVKVHLKDGRVAHYMHRCAKLGTRYLSVEPLPGDRGSIEMIPLADVASWLEF